MTVKLHTKRAPSRDDILVPHTSAAVQGHAYVAVAVHNDKSNLFLEKKLRVMLCMLV